MATMLISTHQFPDVPKLKGAIHDFGIVRYYDRV